MKRKRALRASHAALLVPIIVACQGCAPDFDPPERLTKLRVMAIKLDPVNPAPGESTVLTPLIYAPPGTAVQPFDYAWSWCPVLGTANDGYACPIDDAQLADLRAGLGLPGIPSLNLGAEQTQPFQNPFPVDVLAQLCQLGFEGAVLDCEGGFPVRVNLTVTHAGATQRATTVLRLPVSADAISNVNPAFDANVAPLVAVQSGVEQAIDQLGSVALPRLQETEIRARVSDAQAESYMGLDDQGNAAVVRERLIMTWYVESGALASGGFQTGYFPGQTDIGQFLSAKWKPGSADAYPATDSQLIVVLRDNRNGMSWASGKVTLTPPVEPAP